jgi:hypothetical protein
VIEQLSNEAFNFNVRRYIKVVDVSIQINATKVGRCRYRVQGLWFRV